MTDISAAMFAQKSGDGDKFEAFNRFNSTGRLTCYRSRSELGPRGMRKGGSEHPFYRAMQVHLFFFEILGWIHALQRKITSCESLDGLIHLQSGFPEGLQLREPRTRPIKPAVEPWLQRS